MPKAKDAGHEAFRRAVASILETEVRPLLPALGRYQITLLCRIPGMPEADLVITEDEYQHLARMIRRREAAERAACTEDQPGCGIP